MDAVPAERLRLGVIVRASKTTEADEADLFWEALAMGQNQSRPRRMGFCLERIQVAAVKVVQVQVWTLLLQAGGGLPVRAGPGRPS